MSLILFNAYDLIKDPERWVSGDLETPDGRFCAAGALLLYKGSSAYPHAVSYDGVELLPSEIYRLDAIALQMYPGIIPQGPWYELPEYPYYAYRVSESFHPIVWVNDHLGHAATLAVFEKALVQDGYPYGVQDEDRDEELVLVAG